MAQSLQRRPLATQDVIGAEELSPPCPKHRLKCKQLGRPPLLCCRRRAASPMPTDLQAVGSDSQTRSAVADCCRHHAGRRRPGRALREQQPGGGAYTRPRRRLLLPRRSRELVEDATAARRSIAAPASRPPSPASPAARSTAVCQPPVRGLLCGCAGASCQCSLTFSNHTTCYSRTELASDACRCPRLRTSAAAASADRALAAFPLGNAP